MSKEPSERVTSDAPSSRSSMIPRLELGCLNTLSQQSIVSHPLSIVVVAGASDRSSPLCSMYKCSLAAHRYKELSVVFPNDGMFSGGWPSAYRAALHKNSGSIYPHLAYLRRLSFFSFLCPGVEANRRALPIHSWKVPQLSRCVCTHGSSIDDN